MTGAGKPADRTAWGRYWDSREGREGGCIPAGYAGIDKAQTAAWNGFAKGLPRKARLLDIATGNGSVMRKLLAVRRDLKPVGVDYAATLPPPPPGAKMKGGVAMEQLPFGDARFDAVTSQFGFEYGDMHATAAEIGRVLGERGQLALLIHRHDGPVLAHNRPRAEGLRWVLQERQLIEKASSGLALFAGQGAVPPAIAAAPGEAVAKFGEASVAWELSESIVRALRLGAGRPLDQVRGVLDELDDRARNELGRIESLERACEAARDINAIAAMFTEYGFDVAAPVTLSERPGNVAFATFLTARRG